MGFANCFLAGATPNCTSQTDIGVIPRLRTIQGLQNRMQQEPMLEWIAEWRAQTPSSLCIVATPQVLVTLMSRCSMDPPNLMARSMGALHNMLVTDAKVSLINAHL